MRSLDDVLLGASPVSVSQVYISELALHPISLQLSFEPGDAAHKHQDLFTHFKVLLNLLLALGSITDAPINLNSLTLQNAFGIVSSPFPIAIISIIIIITIIILACSSLILSFLR